MLYRKSYFVDPIWEFCSLLEVFEVFCWFKALPTFISVILFYAFQVGIFCLVLLLFSFLCLLAHRFFLNFYLTVYGNLRCKQSCCESLSNYFQILKKPSWTYSYIIIKIKSNSVSPPRQDEELSVWHFSSWSILQSSHVSWKYWWNHHALPSSFCPISIFNELSTSIYFPS